MILFIAATVGSWELKHSKVGKVCGSEQVSIGGSQGSTPRMAGGWRDCGKEVVWLFPHCLPHHHTPQVQPLCLER